MLASERARSSRCLMCIAPCPARIIPLLNHHRKVQLEYEGKTKDEEDVSGNITIPEVAHDTEQDEYVVRSLCRSTFQSHFTC